MEIFYCDIVCLINDTVEFSVGVGEVLTQVLSPFTEITLSSAVNKCVKYELS